MKTIHNYLLFGALALLLQFVAGCKKEKTREVYFTTSSASASKGGTPVAVTIEFSVPVEQESEITFESIGATPIRFGTLNSVFSRDDSAKCNVTIDGNGFIDSTGHVRVGIGVKKLDLVFTPRNDDNFPHAAAEYKIKMVDAKDATIRTGSDEFTYSIGAAAANINFASTINYSGLEHFDRDSSPGICRDTVIIRAGVFNLQSYTYVKNANGNYDLTINYAFASGNTSVRDIELIAENRALLSLDTNRFDCSNSVIAASYITPGECFFTERNEYYNCADLNANPIKIVMANTTTPNDIYGNYYTLNGTINLTNNVTVDGFTGPRSITGTITSTFWLNQ